MEAADFMNLEPLSPESAMPRARRKIDGSAVLLRWISDMSGRRTEPREWQILSRIRHKNIVTARDLVRTDDGWLLICDDPSGQTIGQWRYHGPFSIGDFLDIAVQAADALAAIHGAGVLHKNLTPGTLLWDDRARRLAIVDFSAAGELSREMAGSGALAIEPAALKFRAPEQTGRFNRLIDHRSDLYALGAVFYAMLTGAPPLDGENALDLVHNLLARAAVPPHLRNPDVPETLSAIVTRLLAKDPEERYQSIAGLRADLDLCRESWTRVRRIEPFAPGARDPRMSLTLPQGLFGRQREIEALLESLDAAAQRRSTAVFLGGYSGIGKTSLVRELQAPVEANRGFFCTGKFDLLKRDIPYLAIAQAFGGLFKDLAIGGAAERAGWLSDIAGRLEDELGLITEIVPEFEALAGRRVPQRSSGPDETQARVFRAFAELVEVLTLDGRTLVLFLDDLQWADAASFDLLESLILAKPHLPLLLIGCFRDNEIDEGHGLTALLGRFERRQTPISRLTLTGLSAETVHRLLSAALQCAPDRSGPLAKHLAAKCQGNPFLLGQALSALGASGLIAFDRAAGQWTWDMAAIEQEPMDEGLAGVVLRRLRELPPDTRRLLSYAACIDNSFDLALAGAAVGLDGQIAFDAARAAVDAGLVLAIRETGSRTMFRFAHDRVRQAFYDLLGDRRADAHYAIGARLMAGGFVHRDTLMAAVSQWNQAIEKLDAAELAVLAQRNLEAARIAQAASAPSAALDFARTACRLLPQEVWSTDYASAFSAHLLALEIAVGLNRDDAIEAHHASLSARAVGRLDQASVKILMILLKVSRGDPAAANDLYKELFRDLGVGPGRVTAYHVSREAAALQLALAGVEPEALPALPSLSDPERAFALKTIATALLTVYVAHDTLHYVWLVLRGMRLVVRHGLHPTAAEIVLSYCVLITHVAGNWRRGRRYGKAAIALAQRPEVSRIMRWTTTGRLAIYIGAWTEPIGHALDTLTQTFQQLTQAGNPTEAIYSSNHILFYGLLSGRSLDALTAETDGFLRFAAASGRATPGILNDLFRQMMANLTGASTPIERLAGPHGNLSDILDFAAASKLDIIAVFCRGLAGYHAALIGDAKAAWEHVAAGWPLRSAALGQVSYVCFAAIAAIGAFAGYADLGARDQRRLRAIANSILGMLKPVAARHEQNAGHLVAMLSAELDWAAGRLDAAWEHYLEAIDVARRHGLTAEEALACRHAAGLAAKRRDKVTAASLRENAARAFRRWGAPPLADALTPGSAAQSAGQIDVMAAVRSSQALAHSMRLSDLLETIMRTVLASAGATRGCLLLQTDGRWRIEAEAAAKDEAVALGAGPPLDDPAVPLIRPMALQVLSMLEPVIVPDAAFHPDYAGDPHVRNRAVKSALCLPLLNRGQLAGLLYLENDMAAGIFGPERLELLNILSGQAAVSIENARLYEDMQALNQSLESQVAARTAELSSAQRAIRRLLDNADQGFMTVGRDLRVGAQFSAACADILGRNPAGRPVTELLIPDSNDGRTTIASILESAFTESSDFTRGLKLALLPHSFGIGERTVDVDFKWLPDDNEIMMVMLSDVTESRRLTAAVERERKRLEMIVTAIGESREFADLVDEFTTFVNVESGPLLHEARASAEARALVYRRVHTFKGLLNQFHFDHSPRVLHELEERLAHGEFPVQAPAQLKLALNRDLDLVTEVLGQDFVSGGGRIALSDEQLEMMERAAIMALQGEFVRDAPPLVVDMLRTLADIRAIDVQSILALHSRGARSLAERLEKDLLPIVIEGDRTRLPPGHAEFLRSLVHVFRNCVDHGIESPEERLLASKPESGAVACRVRRLAEAVEIEISDDGKGIDRAKLERNLAAAGVPPDDAARLRLSDLVMTEGLTSQSAASEISGRGIGLSAVKHELTRLGGTLEVESTPGLGTIFRFRVPRPLQPWLTELSSLDAAL